MRAPVLACFGAQLETWFGRLGAPSLGRKCTFVFELSSARRPARHQRSTTARVLIERGPSLEAMPAADMDPRGRDDPGGSAAYRVRRSVERHAVTGWYEWTLREFLRYLFGIGILGLIVFVPLQMEFSWLPTDAPPILDPSIVALFAVLAMIGIAVIAILAYRAMWGDGRWVDRKVARHRAASRQNKESPSVPPR